MSDGLSQRDAGSPELSVAIPAYNEEAVIEQTVSALAAALAPTGWRYEIVVADDGSTDGTWDLLGRLSARYPALRRVRNLADGGYGMAVKAALAASRGEAVIVAMADGSDLPEDVVAYGRAMLEDGYDCAFGTRFVDPARIKGYPPVKRVLNRLGNGLIAWLVGVAYDDFTNGFKGYRRHVLEGMQPLVSADFNLTVEMSIKAVLGGARYAVIRNGWRDREGGVSKFNLLRLGPRYLLTVAYCLMGHRLGRAGARTRPKPAV